MHNESGSPRWRRARRILLFIAVLATLVAVFHAAENWRGKHAWENCRRQLEDKGVVLDWAAYIPPPVPDASNVLKAPNMTAWFVRDRRNINGLSEPGKQLLADLASGHVCDPEASNGLPVAEITVVSPTAQLDARQGDALVQFTDPGAPEQARSLLRERIGPAAGGVTGLWTFLAKSLNAVKPLRLLLASDSIPSAAQLATFFPSNLLAPNQVSLGLMSRLEVHQAGSNLFRAWLSPRLCSAADYLGSDQPAEPNFELMRTALKRPYARMDGDYDKPFDGPLPDFVTMRVVAQTLAERAQCYLLLQKPDAALHELTLLHDLRILLEGKPSGKATTLVSAMIDVAIQGLYTGIIADGLRLHAWQEPQLVALQQQLSEIDLLWPLRRALETERAGLCRTLEVTRPGELSNLFFIGPAPDDPIWKRLKSASYWASWGPRGWVFQNMVAIANEQERFVQPLNPTNQTVNVRDIESAAEQVRAENAHFSPYNFLAAIAVPNYLKAVQTTARNQTMLNEALVTCALERYRLAHSNYPDSLSALAPQYLARLPLDLITGQPFKYRRIDERAFVLYSVGWNGTDEGGVAGRSVDQGDWVWEGTTS